MDFILKGPYNIMCNKQLSIISTTNLYQLSKDFPVTAISAENLDCNNIHVEQYLSSCFQ